MVISPEKISEVMKELGRRGGSKTSPAKAKAVRSNLKKARASKKKQSKQAQNIGD